MDINKLVKIIILLLWTTGFGFLFLLYESVCQLCSYWAYLFILLLLSFFFCVAWLIFYHYRSSFIQSICRTFMSFAFFDFKKNLISLGVAVLGGILFYLQIKDFDAWAVLLSLILGMFIFISSLIFLYEDSR